MATTASPSLTPAIEDVSEYFVVPVTTLHPEVELGFDTYANIGEAVVLFTATGQAFGVKQRARLFQAGLAEVSIPHNQRTAYYRYLERNILQLLHDEAGNDTERVGRYYQVGTMVSRLVIDEPQGARAEALANSYIDSSLEHLDGCRGLLSGFARVLEVAPDIYQHSLHVCMYGLALARRAGIDDARELRDFGVGLLLHDVGLLAIPSDLRLRPGPLDEEEIAWVKRHPQLGIERVAGAAWLGEIARDVIYSHHERLDASGYPRGVGAAQLSPFARIAAIANAFDSRTTHRPYRPSRTTGEVLRDLIQGARGSYDPRLLANFVRLFST
ncbi:MAG: HD-GYP domain-containing protein [Planctomycetota bacterium]